MKLADLVTADRIVIPFADEDDGRQTTLASAALQLADRLTATGAVLDPAKLRRRVAEERGEDIVAMGGPAFVAHYRTDAVRELVVALGVASKPICRELGGNESQRARIVLVILAPPRFAVRYLQVLGAFAKLLAEPLVVEQMLSARNAEEFTAIPALHSIQLADQLKVGEIMTERPRTITPDTPLKEAARDMVRAGINALPVVETTGLLVGMLSERELMRHLLGSDLGGTGARRRQGGPDRRSVREVMTRQVLAVSPDQAVADVASLMTNKDVDNVPVVKDGRLVGFLTRGDIIRKLIGS